MQETAKRSLDEAYSGILHLTHNDLCSNSRHNLAAGHNEDAASILRQFDVAASSGQQASEQEQASAHLDSAQSHLRESLATSSAMPFAPTPAGGSWATTSQRFHPQVYAQNSDSRYLHLT